MTDNSSESARAQAEQLRGQETEEQKAAVKAQRDAKKAEKAMKKAVGAARTGTELATGVQPPSSAPDSAAPVKPSEARKKETAPPPAACTPESQSLTAKPSTTVKDPLPLQVLSATAITKAAGEDVQPPSGSDVVAQSKALQGQLTEEQKAAVKARRDAKKAEKAEKKAVGAARNEPKSDKPNDTVDDANLDKPAKKAGKKEQPVAVPASGTTPPFQPAVPPSPNPFRRTPEGLFPCVEEAAGGSGSNASFTAAALEVVPKTDPSQSPSAAPKAVTKRKPAPLLPQAASEAAAKSAKNDPASGTPAPRGAVESLPESAMAGNSEADLAEKEMANPLLRPVVHYTPSWNQSLVHHRVAELGLLTREFRVVGSNARTIALIDALGALFQSIPTLNRATAWDSQLITHLYKVLEANESYLNHCRTLCQGMKYVMERLRFTLSSQLGKACNTATDGAQGGSSSFLTGMERASESSITTTATSRSTPLLREPMRVHTDHKSGHTPKPYILNFLQELRETVLGGLNAISKEAVQRIKNGDIILTYGRSSSVEGVFMEAHEKKIEFSVIVLDSAPLFEGRTFATRLQNCGIPVVYGLLSAACLLANRCTKAFFGASTVLGSGDVVSRAGTAIVALAAKNVRKPVLILSETYKFTTSVWLLSLTGNEETRFLNEWSKTNNGVPVETGHFELGFFPPRRQKPGDYGEGEVPASPTTMGKPFFDFPGEASPGAVAPKQSPPPDGAPTFAGRSSSFPLQSTKAPAPLLGARPAANPTATPPPVDITRYACTATAKTGQIVSDGYLYDITPRACIDFIITDGGILHPTGVAAAVRERDEREGRGKTRHF